jgi:hypothetical protein
MKLCTRALVTKADPDGSVTELDVLDVSLVDDDHEFGLRPGTQELHIEAGPLAQGEP